MTTGLYNENVVKSILITQKSYSNNLKWAVLKKKKMEGCLNYSGVSYLSYFVL